MNTDYDPQIYYFGLKFAPETPWKEYKTEFSFGITSDVKILIFDKVLSMPFLLLKKCNVFIPSLQNTIVNTKL